MPTFSSSAKTSAWTYKEDWAKTTGSTLYLITSDTATTPAAARAWFVANVASKGSDYPGTSGGVLPCTEIEIKAWQGDETRTAFAASLSFDNTRTVTSSPLSQPTEYETDAETFEEAYYVDKQSTPAYARHTNGLRFAELPKRQTSIRSITITKNVAAANTMATYDALQDTVNQNSVTLDGVTYPARTLFVQKIALSKSMTANGTAYKVLTTVIKANKNTWDQKFESAGVLELVSGSLKAITNADGLAVSDPWPLQSTGAKAATLATAGYEIVLKPYTQSSSLAAII